jgi:hypothetical protein
MLCSKYGRQGLAGPSSSTGATITWHAFKRLVCDSQTVRSGLYNVGDTIYQTWSVCTTGWYRLLQSRARTEHVHISFRLLANQGRFVQCAKQRYPEWRQCLMATNFVEQC